MNYHFPLLILVKWTPMVFCKKKTPDSQLQTPDSPRPLLHHPNRLFLRTEHVVYVYQILGEFVVAFGHEPDEDVQVMDTIEDQDFFPGDFIFSF